MFNTEGEIATDCVTCADLHLTSSNFPVEHCDNLNDAIRECPKWARSGCFVADTLLYDQDGELEDQDVYRGCSIFSWKSNQERCSKMAYNGYMGDDFTSENTQRYSICKTVCSDDHCNTEQFPLDPIDQMPDECPCASATFIRLSLFAISCALIFIL